MRAPPESKPPDPPARKIASAVERTLAGIRPSPRTPPTQADRLEAGIDAFMKGRYDDALACLRPYAEAGNARAASILARMYFAGNGVTRDHAQYVAWLRVAADAGDRTAKAKLKRLQRGTKPGAG